MQNTAGSLKHTLFQKFHDTAEQFIEPPKSSIWEKTGKLTPDEFVQAGDLLIQKSPNWNWCQGNPENARSFLPTNKQYLQTTRVKSIKRAEEIHKIWTEAIEKVFEIKSDENGSQEQWIVAENPLAKVNDGAKITLESDSFTTTNSVSNNSSQYATSLTGMDDSEEDEDDGEDDEPEASESSLSLALDVDIQVNEIVDQAAVEVLPQKLNKKHRFYDVSVCYDNYYHVPRIFLLGFDSDDKPLSPQDMIQDVSSDHALKTVTTEKHPYTGITQLSIHPCQHAATFLTFIHSSVKKLTPDQSIVVFLKFMSSAIPTIDYDT